MRRDPELELDPADLLAQRHAHLRVERGERLVEQQHARLDRERARQGDALLHAARELVRIALARVPEPDELEQLADPLPPVGLRLAPDPQPVLDVLLGGHVREEAVGLEDHPHVALVGRRARQVLPVDDDPSGVGLVEAGDEAQRRRLAAAARAEQRDELPRVEREVDPLERRDRAEGAPQLLELDVGGHQRPIPTRTVRCPPRRPISRIESMASQVMPKLNSVAAAAGYALSWLICWR